MATIGLGVGAEGLIAGAIMIAIGGPTTVERTTSRQSGERVRARLPWTVWGSPMGGASGGGGVIGVTGAF
jgi:hypothetical protein